MRLMKLHELLATLAKTSATPTPAQILLELVAYNSGYVRDLATANNNFRVCGDARILLAAAMDKNITSTDPQAAALLRIKQYIDTTGVLQDWSMAAGATQNYCVWKGVSCSGNRQVSAINIWSALTTDLKGRLPPADAFKGLDMLTHFILAEQPGITGTLPGEWSQLRSLEEVEISETSITGSIPSSWGSWAKLKVLNLWGNQLTGHIPDSFGALASLQDLRLSRTGLGGSIPTSLGNLTELRVLYLWGNRLTGRIPESFGALTFLESMQLSTNLLTGTIPSALGRLTMLKVLYLYQNHLTGHIPDSLGALSSIEDLQLSQNRLTGGLPPSLGNLTT
jgi:Leucine-rich repeat (LRR) protein